ncbi:MAG: AAA family ATPase [Lentisphaerae bacterium]|nr:AAA family ATPase [Lentisphaerota bacterium]
MKEAQVEEAAAQELERIRAFALTYRRLREEIGKRIVGQARIVDDLLTAVLTRGHALLIGVPGLAKTLLVRTLGEILELKFSRVQFTPDLMPADITGTEVLEEDRTTGRRVFRFVEGPLFANLVLADEVNRAPPKTQAALLQAMQERTVSVGPQTYPLPDPFFVLATQNPIEQEGTYPLPEAQLDRFMFALHVDYPSHDEERRIALETTGRPLVPLEKMLDGKGVRELQDMAVRLAVSEHVADYAVRLTRASRPKTDAAPDFVRQYVAWGAGPRAVQYLVLGAKARAVLEGTANVSCGHIRDVAPIVLRHRVLTNFAAEADNVDSDRIVARLLEHVPESGT